METKICVVCKVNLPISDFYMRADRNRPRSTCKSCFSQKAKDYQARNLEKVKQQDKDYRNRKGEKLKENASLVRFRMKYELLDLLGGKCVDCGYDDYRALQIDHINGGGRDDREQFKGSSQYLKHLLSLSDEKLREKYQILCANCNAIKRLEKGEHGQNSKGRWQSVKDRLGAERSGRTGTDT